jgi:hypothetical protein
LFGKSGELVGPSLFSQKILCMCQNHIFQVVNVQKFIPPQKTLMHMYSNIFILKPKKLALLVLPKAAKRTTKGS